MKAVLMSIKKQWIEKILDGEKTIEIRKTKPNLEVPFKVYIYCTKDNQHYDLYINENSAREVYGNFSRLRAGQDEVVETRHGFNTFIAHGKVIGEFVCDKIDEYVLTLDNGDNYSTKDFMYSPLKDACLTQEEIVNYGNGKMLYGWHISDLKIYDKPKELSEFRKYYECGNNSCGSCDKCDKDYHLTIPPQSWCYVEEK